MKRIPWLVLLVASVIACSTDNANAALLGSTGPLSSDTNAMPGWHNTVGYANAFGLVGQIEFAVWAPGTFPGGFLGYVPSGPNYYVYTYQSHETGHANLSQVSVTLTGPVDNTNIGSFVGNDGFGLIAGDAPGDGINPVSSPVPAPFVAPFDTANWYFDGVVTGGSTRGLAFSSLNGPIWTQSRLVDDGTVAFAIPVPSPTSDNIPEPGTLTLALCGVAIWIGRWCRQRRNAL